MPRPATATAVLSRKSVANAYEYEGHLHRTVAELLDWCLQPPTVFTTFPAGWAKLPKATAGRLRAAGLKAGIPDILVFHNSRCIGVELKIKGRKPSAAQQLMFPRLRLCGMPIYVCESTDDVIEAMRREQVPLRGRFGWPLSHGEDYEAGDSQPETRSAQELT